MRAVHSRLASGPDLERNGPLPASYEWIPKHRSPTGLDGPGNTCSLCPTLLLTPHLARPIKSI